MPLEELVFSGIESSGKQGSKMQGLDKEMILSNKLDKNICLKSLLIMSTIAFTPKVLGFLSLVNISGAFKQ